MTASALLIAFAIASSSAPIPDPAAAAAAIGASDALALSALEDFERSGSLADARRALAAGVEARDRLEAARVPASLAGAREEELIFLNHLVPGLASYLAAPRSAFARERLDAVLRRGRAHRELSRRALREALGPAGRTPAPARARGR